MSRGGNGVVMGWRVGCRVEHNFIGGLVAEQTYHCVCYVVAHNGVCIFGHEPLCLSFLGGWVSGGYDGVCMVYRVGCRIEHHFLVGLMSQHTSHIVGHVAGHN